MVFYDGVVSGVLTLIVMPILYDLCAGVYASACCGVMETV
jgi:hypothetical protein